MKKLKGQRCTPKKQIIRTSRFSVTFSVTEQGKIYLSRRFAYDGWTSMVCENAVGTSCKALQCHYYQSIHNTYGSSYRGIFNGRCVFAVRVRITFTLWPKNLDENGSTPTNNPVCKRKNVCNSKNCRVSLEQLADAGTCAFKATGLTHKVLVLVMMHG